MGLEAGQESVSRSGWFGEDCGSAGEGSNT